MDTTVDFLAYALARVGRGDRSAFDLLYRATSSKLYGVIVRIVGDRTSADDVLQEVYATIWKNAGSFDPARGSPLAWMSTMARNRALDEIRRRKATQASDIEDIPELAGENEHPLDRAQRSEGLQKLVKCLAGLDPQRREMILLAYYRGASRESLATKFSAPAATIKSWLRRSLMQLKACMES